MKHASPSWTLDAITRCVLHRSLHNYKMRKEERKDIAAGPSSSKATNIDVDLPQVERGATDALRANQMLHPCNRRSCLTAFAFHHLLRRMPFTGCLNQRHDTVSAYHVQRRLTYNKLTCTHLTTDNEAKHAVFLTF